MLCSTTCEFCFEVRPQSDMDGFVEEPPNRVGVVCHAGAHDSVRVDDANPDARIRVIGNHVSGPDRTLSKYAAVEAWAIGGKKSFDELVIAHPCIE